MLENVIACSYDSFLFSSSLFFFQFGVSCGTNFFLINHFSQKSEDAQRDQDNNRSIPRKNAVSSASKIPLAKEEGLYTRPPARTDLTDLYISLYPGPGLHCSKLQILSGMSPGIPASSSNAASATPTTRKTVDFVS